MKIKTIIAAALASMAIAACAQNNNSPELKALEPSKSQIDSVSYLMGIQFAASAQGWGFGTDFNYNEMVKGFKDFFNAKGNPQSVEFMDQFKISPELMNQVFTEYIDKISAYKGAKGLAESEAFLAANKLKDGVAVTSTGLQYIIEEKGNGVVPKPKTQSRLITRAPSWMAPYSIRPLTESPYHSLSTQLSQVGQKVSSLSAKAARSVFSSLLSWVTARPEQAE